MGIQNAESLRPGIRAYLGYAYAHKHDIDKTIMELREAEQRELRNALTPGSLSTSNFRRNN
jgi:hypothetical protein